MSSRNMTINQIKAVDKDFGAKHTITVKGFNDGGRTTTRDLILAVREELLAVRDEILAVRDEMHAGFAQINARIDNLVAKNNLKE